MARRTVDPLELAREAFAEDRITAAQLEFAVAAALRGEMGIDRLRRLLVDWEGANQARPMPEGVDEMDLEPGWWKRSDGTLVEICGQSGPL